MLLPMPPVPPDPYKVEQREKAPRNAELVINELFKVDGVWTLIHHRTEWLLYTGTHYQRIPADELESRVSWYFANAVWWKPGNATGTVPGEWKSFPVTRSTLGDIMNAIRNLVIIPDHVNIGDWIVKHDDDPDASDLVPMANGLLNTVSRELVPSTPRFLNTYSLPFPWNPEAPEPVYCYAWMRSMFGRDDDRIRLAQEGMAYYISGRTDLHKMLCLTGPPRSGKGTYARLVKQLVGAHNYGSTSMSELGGAHGLEEIARKPVVLFGDAAYTGREAGLAMERLLGVIGEDDVTVNPKNRPIYTAKLPCRFLLLANDLPTLPDKSQALRARWLHLRFDKSFAGAEDRELDAKLASELPGIFKWALDGLDRLRMRGEFIQPEVGKVDLDLMTRMVSPETAWVDECLFVARDDSEVYELTQTVYLAWQNWCKENGVTGRSVGSSATLTKRLRRVAKTSHVEPGRAGRDASGKQQRVLFGIQLTDEARAKYVMSEFDFDASQAGIDPAYMKNLGHKL